LIIVIADDQEDEDIGVNRDRRGASTTLSPYELPPQVELAPQLLCGTMYQ
jgi:hypothetical protein